MRVRRLETRFFLASCLLLGATVASGVWSTFTFARLSRVVDESLRQSHDTIDVAAKLASALEREDDALLLALAGDTDRAEKELRAERGTFDEGYAQLTRHLSDPAERAAASSLREHVDAYRAAGDALMLSAKEPDSAERYHRYVNPLLRRSVGDCAVIREDNFRAMEAAGISARDVATRSTWVVAIVSMLSFAVSTIVSLHLARTVARPIRELTASVDALREGDFDRRVEVATSDEIGRLGEGFNRMAQALAEFRRSNLGEVLRAKEALEATLAALPDAVLVVGPDERIESANPTASAFLGQHRMEGAQSLTDVGLPAPTVEAVRRALRGERQPTATHDLSHSLSVESGDGARKLMPIAAAIREVAQGRSGAVLVLHDVSDFARLDELRTEMIGVASHELKTPLTTLRVNLMLLSETEKALSPHQREIVATAIAGCEELADTVDELLDLTRIEAGKLRLEFNRLDLRILVKRAVGGVLPRFQEAGVHLDVRDNGSPAFLRGDAARLAIVLSNLLSNALNHTPAGGRVTVEVASVQNAGSNPSAAVQVAVTDTGTGVADEFRERIFEKFFQAQDERHGGRTRALGAGIGLYLCRQIVERTEGRFVVRGLRPAMAHGL